MLTLKIMVLEQNPPYPFRFYTWFINMLCLIVISYLCYLLLEFYQLIFCRIYVTIQTRKSDLPKTILKNIVNILAINLLNICNISNICYI